MGVRIPASPPLVVTPLEPRARVADSIVDLVGNTPLLRLANIDAETPGVEIWAKAEFTNPGGSVKDRPARQMILDAFARGDLRPGMRLIDSTSGNTGIAYSMLGAALGIDVTLVMPENVSVPRKQVTQAYGTELVYSDPMDGSDGAIRLVRQMVAEAPDRFYYPDQYGNRSNWWAHYIGTGAEIWSQTGGRVTHFVAGVGTSGTVMGCTRRLKHENPRVSCYGLQPEDELHGLEGLKHLPSSIVPAIYDGSVLDGTIWLPTDEGWDMSERLAKEEGLFVGHSAGGNVAGALRIAKELHGRGERGVVVTVLCDRGDRYFVPLKWEKEYLW